MELRRQGRSQTPAEDGKFGNERKTGVLMKLRGERGRANVGAWDSGRIFG